MKLPYAKIDPFIQSPDQGITCALIYGPDAGLVSERAKKLTQTLIDDLKDPFRIAELSYNTIKDDPSIFADELNAMCLTGGRRLIKIRDASAVFPKDLGDAITSSKSDTFTIFLAGELAPSAALRKFFEKEKTVVALPCYKDDSRSIRSVIESTLRTQHFRWDADAMAYLANSFSGDRLVVLSEIEKLIVYMGDEKHIRLSDAQACIDNSAEASLDNLCNAVADQNPASIEQSLNKALLEGIAPVTIIRAILRYLLRLQSIKGQATHTGTNEEQVISSLKPPVFFKQIPLLKRHLGLWNERTLSKVLAGLVELEIECKKTGSPPELLCSRFLTILPLAVKR